MTPLNHNNFKVFFEYIHKATFTRYLTYAICNNNGQFII